MLASERATFRNENMVSKKPQREIRYLFREICPCRLSTVAIFRIVLLALTLVAPKSFAESQCNPLLMLIEGGFDSSSGQAVSIPRLADAIRRDYSDKGITVTVVDNGPYWEQIFLGLVPKFLPNRVRKTASTLKRAGYWPLVIVGHSLGGATAYHLSRRYPTSLLVTLDPVSMSGNRAHLERPQGSARWINVISSEDAVGPDWGYQKNAENIWVDAGHSDTEIMFDRVKDKILEILSRCSKSIKEPKSKELCAIDGVDCTVKWTLTDGCSDDRGVDVKFFEYDVDWNRIAYWDGLKISNSDKRTFSLSCDSPGNFVCFGASRDSETYWGRGLDGDEWCDRCCGSCQAGSMKPQSLICDG